MNKVLSNSNFSLTTEYKKTAGSGVNSQQSVQRTNNFKSLFEAFDSYSKGTITDNELDKYKKEQLYLINKSELFPIDTNAISDKSENRASVYSVTTAEQIQKDYEFLVHKGPTTFNFDKDGNVILPAPKPTVYGNKPLAGHTALVSANEIRLGEGSKIDLYGGYSVHINEGSAKYCYNDKIISPDALTDGEHKQFYEETQGLTTFLNLLKHHANGDISSSYIGSIDNLKANTEKYLNYMGIDTNKPFTINGTKFQYFTDAKGGSVMQVK